MKQNSYGFSEEQFSEILSVLRRYDDIERVYLFGSRAKNTYHDGSDVDLAIKGDSISRMTLLSLLFQLNEETLLPWKFDVLDYTKINNPDLQEHIDRAGICIYNKKTKVSSNFFKP